MVTVLTIFQLYRGSQLYRWRKLEYPEKTIDLPKTNHTLEMCTSLKMFPFILRIYTSILKKICPIFIC